MCAHWKGRTLCWEKKLKKKQKMKKKKKKRSEESEATEYVKERVIS